MKHWNSQLLELLNRDALPQYLSRRAPGGNMAEIGTYFGEFAEHILRGWNGHLSCIDPWKDLDDGEYRDGCANGGVAGGRNPMSPIFTSAVERLAPYRGQCTILRTKSETALKVFNDEWLDCVYIDGNHKFDYAMADLDGWWPKVKPGGLIGIHDCYIRRDEVQDCGVWDAVWEMSNNCQQHAFLTNCSSAWWIK